MKVKFRLMGILLLLACAIALYLLLPRVGKGESRVVHDEAAEPEVEALSEEVATPEPEEEAVSAPAIPAAPSEPVAVREEEEDTTTDDAERSSENPDYKDGNGTVLAYVESDWVRKIIRKCEMEVTVGGMLADVDRIVYGSMEKENPVATLADGDNVSILQQCTLEYLQEPGDELEGDRGDLWYKVRLADGTDGWICAGNEYLGGGTPYYGNSYEVLGTVSSGGRKWTVRKLNQTLSVSGRLSMRNKPGTGGGTVLYTIRPGDTDPAQVNVELTAITEEEDVVDGITDRWLKVKYKGYEGWIFGGYASVERGGPKYHIPEQWIAFDLGGLS